MGYVEGVQDLRLGDLVGARLDHQDRLLGTGDHQVELGLIDQVLLLWIDHEVALHLADPHRADRRGERDVGDHQRRGGAVHRKDVIGVDVID